MSTKAARVRSRQAEYRRRLMMMGLCPECGLPAEAGRIRCRVHLEKQARAKRVLREVKQRKLP